MYLIYTSTVRGIINVNIVFLFLQRHIKKWKYFHQMHSNLLSKKSPLSDQLQSRTALFNLYHIPSPIWMNKYVTWHDINIPLQIFTCVTCFGIHFRIMPKGRIVTLIANTHSIYYVDCRLIHIVAAPYIVQKFYYFGLIYFNCYCHINLLFYFLYYVF